MIAKISVTKNLMSTTLLYNNTSKMLKVKDQMGAIWRERLGLRDSLGPKAWICKKKMEVYFSHTRLVLKLTMNCLGNTGSIIMLFLPSLKNIREYNGLN